MIIGWVFASDTRSGLTSSRIVSLTVTVSTTASIVSVLF
jgi:hypothetical protein